MEFPSRLLAALLVLAGIVVAGGVIFGGFGGDDPDGEELVADVVAGGDFETFNGTRTHETELEHVGEEEPRISTITETVWADPPDRLRAETLASSAGSSSPGDVRVVDGSTLKSYFAEAGQMLVDDEWEAEVEQFETDPVLEDFEAEYVGTETVAGREAYVVEIEPAAAPTEATLALHFGEHEFEVAAVEPDGEANVSQTTTWWIDAETAYPLKEQVEREYENPEAHVLQRESSVRTTVYEDITFDAPLPAETFTIDPPEGTEIYEPAEPLGVETVAEADENAPFAVPEPSVPEGFELQLVSGTEFRGDVTVEMLYREGDDIREDDSIWIRVTEHPPDHEQEETLEENVGEVNGTLVEHSLGTAFVYHCEDVRYEVIPDVESDEREVATDVAESMGCG